MNVIHVREVMCLIMCVLLAFGGEPLRAGDFPGERGVDFDKLLSERNKYLDKEVAFDAYVFIDGEEVYLFGSLAALDSFNGFDGAVFIAPKERNKFAGLHGCKVVVVGVITAHPKLSDYTYLSGLSEVSRTGYFYFAAKELKKRQGKSGEPSCIGKALVKLMAE